MVPGQVCVLLKGGTRGGQSVALGRGEWSVFTRETRWLTARARLFEEHLNKVLENRPIDPTILDVGAILEVLIPDEAAQRLARGCIVVAMAFSAIVTVARHHGLKRPGGGARNGQSLIFRALAEVQVVQPDQLRQLRNRIRIVIHAVVKPAVVVPTVSTLGLNDDQCRALPSAAIATGPISGGQGGKQPLRQIAGRTLECQVHLLHHLRSGQDVALNGNPGRRRPTGPVEARVAGEGGTPAPGVDQADLALISIIIAGQEVLERLESGHSRGQQLQAPRPVSGIGQRLSGDSSGAGCGPRDDCPDGRELRGDGDTPGGPGRIEGDDREGRRSEQVGMPRWNNRNSSGVRQGLLVVERQLLAALVEHLRDRGTLNDVSRDDHLPNSGSRGDLVHHVQ